MRRWADRLLAATAVLASLVPVVVIVRAVARYARNVPWWDQWGLVPFMADVAAGRLHGGLLWMTVNEHRIPVSLLLQGAVAWWTRWDIRGDAWINVGLGLGSLAMLVTLARRSLSPRAALVVSPILAAIAFSPIAAASWTTGWITPMFTATFFATVTARLTAGTPTWPRLAATLVAATAGALSFGTGLVLVVLLPAMWLVLPGAPPVRRAVQAAVALAAGAALVWVYFMGWYPRTGMPPPVFHPERTSTYVEYALAYVGGAAGFRPMQRGSTWGAFMLAAATLATVLLWWRRPQRRGALVPWVFLVLYGLASGFVTAYGRLDNGMFTAQLPRYAPTAGLFAAGVTGVVALAVAELYARSRLAATVVMVVLAFPLGQAARGFVGASRAGLAEIAGASRRIDQRATCLRTCATATDGCLGLLCWDARVARGFCPLMERARIGPFRNTTAGGRVASDARPG